MTKASISSLRGTMAAAIVLSLISPLATFAAGPAAVNLGSSGNFTILSKTGISTTGTTAVVGDIGVSPAAATYITGFSLALPAAGAYSTSALVTGKVYAPGYADPTPATLTTAVLDMQTAYTDAAGRASTVTELGAGNIGGLTLVPGVYKWGTGVTIPSDVTLSGGANDVWIFQIAQNLSVSSGVHINLSGGAQASNVFWQVAGQTTLGTTAVFNGNILDQTAIVLNTGARLNGRALAQTAVTLDSSTVTNPGSSSYSMPVPVVTPAPTPTPSPAPVVMPTPTPMPVTTMMQTQSQTSGLTSQQKMQYDQFMAAGASQSAALNAVNQISGSVIPQSSAFGQQVKAIAVTLMAGSNGSGVATLQQFLITQNKGSAARALAGFGATSHFGALTKAALAEFQASVGISPALGNFGPITRAYIAQNNY